MSIKLCEVTLTFIGGSIPDIAEGHTHFIEHMFVYSIQKLAIR